MTIEPTPARGVYADRGNLFTRKLAGDSVYGERIVNAGGVQYREWKPWRSKLAAALKSGLREFPFQRDSRVLYLGAASGTTSSHVSDLCPEGKIFCVEVSPRSFRDLLTVASVRPNMFPLKADARHPEHYKAIVSEVDVVYQDIAQRDQERIFLSNVSNFLRPGGRGFLMIKARSIAVAERPDDIFRRINEVLTSTPGIKVLEKHRLEPFHKDHMAVVVSYK